MENRVSEGGNMYNINTDTVTVTNYDDMNKEHHCNVLCLCSITKNLKDVQSSVERETGCSSLELLCTTCEIDIAFVSLFVSL
jgi:hypothetical protein